MSEFSGSPCLCLAGTGDTNIYHGRLLHGLQGFEPRFSCFHNKNLIDFPAPSLAYTVTTNKLINSSICYRSHSRPCMVLIFKTCNLFSESLPQLSFCLESHNPSVCGNYTTKYVSRCLEHLILSGIAVVFLMCFSLFLLCVSGEHIL